MILVIIIQHNQGKDILAQRVFPDPTVFLHLKQKYFID